MKYTLIAIFIALSLGILLATHLEISFSVLYLWGFLFLALSIIFVKKTIRFNISILCATIFIGAALLRNSQVLPDSHIFNLTPKTSVPAYIIGVIDSDPLHKKRCTSFVLRATDLCVDKMWHNVCGNVLVRIYADETKVSDRFFYGNTVAMKGKIFRPFSSTSFNYNYREYLKHQGIYAIFSVKEPEFTKWLMKDVKNPLKYYAYKIKQKLKNVYLGNLSPLSSGIFNAIILGDRGGLPSGVMSILTKTGTVHIIAISGLNLGIVAFLVLALLKIFRIPRNARYFLAIIILILYCVVTGANAPVVRSTVMAVILLAGFMFRRELNIYNSLAFAAIVMLAVNPWQLFEISFQLSFLSLFFIVYLTPKIQSLFPKSMQKTPFTGSLILLFCTSCAAWLGLLPLIAYYFRLISPITILANMIIVPYMTLITISGFSLALTGLAACGLTAIFASSAEVLISFLLTINYVLVAVPHAYFSIPQISFSHVMLYYFLLTLFIVILDNLSKDRRK